MRRLRSLLCLLVLSGSLSGCDAFVFVSAGPLPDQRPSPTSSPAPTSIAVGDIVHSTFVVPEVRFDLRAPTTGILFVRISWDSRHGDIDVTFVSSVFASNVLVRDISTSVSTGQTTAVHSVRVARGETCRIAVVGARGPVPFTLTTSIE
jgi:hypothetical protein